MRWSFKFIERSFGSQSLLLAFLESLPEKSAINAKVVLYMHLGLSGYHVFYPIYEGTDQ